MALPPVTIKLRLDTQEAEQSLNDLSKKGESAARRAGTRVRSDIMKGLGLGAGIGVGVQAVRGATSSGFADVIGEAISPIGAQIAEWALGDLNDKARAGRYAREATINAFAYQVGRDPAALDRAKRYFDSVSAIRKDYEAGVDTIRSDSRFSAFNASDFLDKLLSGIGDLLLDAAEALGRWITTPGNWFR